MAQKRTIDIDINTNADQAAKEFDDLGKATNRAAKSVDNLDATFEEVYGELQPLTTRMGEAEDRLYELALAGDTTSKEYQQLLEKVGEYRKVQIQTDLAVDGAATTLGQKLGSALNGATSGFAATQGAMALFGSENQALEKSLVKVQAALAIQQGVQGLTVAYRELGGKTGIATKAQAAFNFVMNLNPIVAIVGGVVALVAALGKFTNVLDPVINKVKQFTDFIGLTSHAEKELEEQRKINHQKNLARIDDNIRQLGFELDKINEKADAEERLNNIRLTQIQLDKDKATSTKELLGLEEEATNVRIEMLDKEFQKFVDTQKNTIKTKQEEADRLQAIIDRNIAKGRSDHTSEMEQLKFRQQEINEIQQNLATNNFAIYQEIEQKKVQATRDGEKAIVEIRQKANQDYKANLQERLNIARRIEDLENQLMEDGLEKELEINRDKFRRLREDTEKNTNLTRKEREALNDLYDKQEIQAREKINKKYVDLEKSKNEKIDAEKQKLNQERINQEDALFQLELSLMKDREMAEIIALSQSYDEKYLLAVDNAELTKQLDAQFLLDQAAIQDKFRTEKAAKDKAASDKEKAEAKEVADYKEMVVSKSLNAISEVAALFSDGSEKQARRAFNVQKAVGIAQATIDTSLAIMKVAKETTDPSPIQGFRIANMVAMGVAGAAQIAAIASAKFQGGSTGDVPTPTGSSGGGGETQAPSFNVVGDSSINQLAQLQQAPVQAFVVSGEVTTSQALDRNRVENATL